MDAAEPDAPVHKRPRLNSLHPPPYNGLPPPHPVSQNSPFRHSAHPPSSPATHAQAPYPPHGLPSYPYPPPPGPPSSVPHQDRSSVSIQTPTPQLVAQERSAPPGPYQQPPESAQRPGPSPHQRTHGFSVTVPRVPPAIDQDRISDYSRPPVTPQSTGAETQLPRPPTTTKEPNPQPVMERSGPAAPWSASSDHPPNGTYPSNGYPRVVNSPQHSDQPFHTPSLPPTQYAPLVPTYGAPSHGPYMGGSEAYGNQVKRKHVRATQACNHCRSRKQKCDEARPCQFCRDNGLECLYKDVPPPKMDRSMMQLQESMNGVSETLKSFIAEINAWRQTVDRKLSPTVELDRMTNPLSPEQIYGAGPAMNERHGSQAPTPVQGRGYYPRVDNIKAESPVATNSTMSPPAGPVSTPGRQEFPTAIARPSATPVDSANVKLSTPVQKEDDVPSAFPVDHTTPAHQILQDWPTMRDFSKGIEVIENLKRKGKNIADYPMQLERFRGVVRVHGVGEGLDTCDGTQGLTTTPDSNGAPDTPSPPYAEMKPWGPLTPESPPTLVDEGSAAADHDRGRRFDCRLLLDKSTVERLFDSYCRHIHPLQPFLNIKQLKRMVQNFAMMYGPESRRSQSHAGTKRKRCADCLSGYSDTTAYLGYGIHRSVHNAIVLLVLALGKVCEWKDPLPAPEADAFPVESQRLGYMRKSSRSASVNSSFNSDHEETRKRNIDRLPGMLYYCIATDMLGNLTGGFSIGHAQANVLAALYAGQYARVMESWSWINNACRICIVLVKEEMPFIQRKLEFERPDERSQAQSQTLNPNPSQQPSQTPASNPPATPGLSPSTQHEDKEEKELQAQRNLIKLLYWACLQLETDILAEMSTLPPSHIAQYQDIIDYPKGVGQIRIQDLQMPYEQWPEDQKIMVLYSSQIHLRVLLNHAHKTLYQKNKLRYTLEKNDKNDKDDVVQSSLLTVAHAAREQFEMLKAWKRLQPPALRWEDHDPPATDINIARLRAKYYGAQYMVLRPYLEIALHDVPFPPNGATSDRSSHGSDAGLGDISTPMSARSVGATPPETSSQAAGIVELLPDFKSIVEVARLCVESAIQSTIAFDRVGHQPNDVYRKYVDTPKGRLIVTNIFGTMHAQFGNMIVLAAVMMSGKNKLSQLLPGLPTLTKQTFGDLLARTIKMLRQVGDNSPTLTTDADILENIQKLAGVN
ncbi:uncharacterized protein EI97DRAFT_234236 [Westerdykella ornata]|uniref:Zn(2)-C6 fungal-type domain-containing protein n=1 Tax=Westerdykella ornata TaxID=318751 RepID=A0A6A6J6B8_WESOR|nr:uncharacterized protein EI97DRAFT_234236 [Westerdykella ornata]KAF2272121.1 hypothetical protein EI97DRAFT_234236 [Westerdykella ornata]